MRPLAATRVAVDALPVAAAAVGTVCAGVPGAWLHLSEPAVNLPAAHDQALVPFEAA